MRFVPYAHSPASDGTHGNPDRGAARAIAAHGSLRAREALVSSEAAES